ncbi:hypothetical protein K9M42_00930 [Patescibacteria group bacterium]|nr:hypothetical protein [Patescibacteria group bacterium]
MSEEEKTQKLIEHLVKIRNEVDIALEDYNLNKKDTSTIKNKLNDVKEYKEDEDKVIEGIFNGEIMIGPEEKQYSIPSNYISKSKIIEGDKLKLTIKPDGTFVYKQIELMPRKRTKGILSKSKDGGFEVLAEGKTYKVQKASITYYKGEIGDEVIILVPKNNNSVWAGVENIIKSGNKENKEIKAISLEELKNN